MRQIVFRLLISRVFPPVCLVLWAVIGVIAALTGPFGTYEDMTLLQRAAFWVLFVGIAIAVGRGVRVALESGLPDKRAWVLDAIQLAVIVPAITFTFLGFMSIMPRNGGLNLPSGFMVASHVLAIGLVLVGFRRAVRIEPKVDNRDPVMPRLVQRLPVGKRAAILRLSARDHHVEVVTTQGNAILRMRLADAIREMEPIEGYCTHRSHWVARAAIERVERQNAAKWWVVLSNGDRMPLTPKYRPALQAAGIEIP